MKNTIIIALALLSASATAQVSAGQYALQRKNVGAGFSLIPLTPTADNIWTFNGSGGVTSIPRNTFALSGHIHALNDLSDVTITAPALNDVLQWNGSAWVNAVASGGGDVVGPASSTDNNVPQWDGTTGKLLKDGLGVSQGGNGAADANKLVQFKSDGGIGAATGLLAGPALYGETGALNQPGIQGYSTNGGEGGRFQSVGGDGVSGSSDSGAGLRGTSGTGPGVHANVTDAANVTDLALFHRDDNLGLEVRNNGALAWTTPDGASDTRTNLGLIRRKITTATTGVSTSYTDVTDMSFSVVAGTTYSFIATVLAECSSTSGGVCLTANGPAATWFAARYEGSQAAGSIIRSDITAYDTMGSLADPNSVAAANTPYVFTLQGVIVPSANGTFTLRVKRGGTTGNVAVRAGVLEATAM